MNETMRKILEAAIMAPSGDNCQPWRFAVSNNQIDVYDVPEADTSYYNYRQRASYVSHGAVLENIALAAPQLGLEAQFDIFPDQDTPECVARITLTECIPKSSELAAFITKRGTNRKIYRGGLLDSAQLNALTQPSDDLPNVFAFLTNKRSEIDRLSEVICLSDRLVYENKRLHDFLYEHIRWSDEEAAKFRDGLDIKTLELKAIDEIGFKLLKSWPLTNFLGKLGVTGAVSTNARKQAGSASAIGVILGRDPHDPITYVQGGRLLQRLWLQATRMELSFHPMAGICFLMQRVADRQAGDLSSRHIKMIEDAVREVATLTGSPEPNVISLFRVGVALPPRARSQRRASGDFLNQQHIFGV